MFHSPGIILIILLSLALPAEANNLWLHCVGNCYNGYGSAIGTEGVYAGQWIKGGPKGKGVLKTYDGKTWSGTFTATGLSGAGVKKTSNGKTYVGNFKDDKRHGQGIYFGPAGEIIRGEYKNDKVVKATGYLKNGAIYNIDSSENMVKVSKENAWYANPSPALSTTSGVAPSQWLNVKNSKPYRDARKRVEERQLKSATDRNNNFGMFD